ncbi:DEDD exonuclease domain-containing protein, partial [Actinomyces naeslundii]|uniref:DEDD exonuclease domain-containing protein n=1 Tax=Actinomyces naeslundii TaxID=1655 RepID=UPI002115E88F
MSTVGTQVSFADMGTPLERAIFVVVDLETTGGAPGARALTEIGAVKVRGGKVLADFSTLVNPGVAIPAQITMLTGITNAMVAGAPDVRTCVEAFLTWAGLLADDVVLVAHNARFDVGHLRGAAAALGLEWPEPRVLDTLALARKAWTRSEVPNHKLGTLAAFVGSRTRPTHRALDDARATVDVLHAALEVMAPLGVTHLEDLTTASDPVPARRRAKSRLADSLPTSPGVYQFRSAADQVLYVGSAADLKRRVRSYFTAAEKRRKVAQMLDTTVSVRHIATPTLIEARVRELRMIAELDPPVNRRSR